MTSFASQHVGIHPIWSHRLIQVENTTLTGKNVNLTFWFKYTLMKEYSIQA